MAISIAGLLLDHGQHGNYSPKDRPRNRRVARDCHIVPGDFTPVLAKHTKSFNLIDTFAVGVDRIQRNFEPLQRQVELWKKTQVTDERAKLIFLQRVH